MKIFPLPKRARALALIVAFTTQSLFSQENVPSELETTVVRANEPEPAPRPVPRSRPARLPSPVLESEPEPEMVPDFEAPVIRDEAPVALKIDVPISETPRSVSVVTQQQFQDRGAL